MILGCDSTIIASNTNQQKLPPSKPVPIKQENDVNKYASYPFSLTMLDVGQGLCILVRSGEEYLVYDGGGRKRSSYVVSFFKRNQIERIKYMVASHYDEDHIAGLIGLLKTMPVNTVIIPNYLANTKIFLSFQSALANANSVILAKEGKTYKLGEAKFEILYATDNTEDIDNNKSTVIRIEFKNFSCIITGDAATETEMKLVNREKNLPCDLYVVGHHGSSSSSSPGFVAAMKPKSAFISVGKDNQYNHPTKRVLKTLGKNNSTVFRTDVHGSVTLVHDGSKYEIHVNKNEIRQ
jgi:competence protein ComEC